MCDGTAQIYAMLYTAGLVPTLSKDVGVLLGVDKLQFGNSCFCELKSVVYSSIR